MSKEVRATTKGPHADKLQVFDTHMTKAIENTMAQKRTGLLSKEIIGLKRERTGLMSGAF